MGWEEIPADLDVTKEEHLQELEAYCSSRGRQAYTLWHLRGLVLPSSESMLMDMAEFFATETLMAFPAAETFCVPGGLSETGWQWVERMRGWWVGGFCLAISEDVAQSEVLSGPGLLVRLEALGMLIGCYERPLTSGQLQSGLRLLRVVDRALSALEPPPSGSPFLEAAMAQVRSSGGKRPVMFIDWMVPFHQARERVSELILRVIAFLPQCEPHNLATLTNRKGLVADLGRLASVLQKVPAFAQAPARSGSRRYPDYLRVVSNDA